MPDRPGLRPTHVTPRVLTDLLAGSGFSLAERAGTDAVADVVVTGVTHDSRQVRPGDLYVALPGAHTHGARFAASATHASAVLTDAAGADIIGSETGVPVFVVEDPRARMGVLADQIYGRPSRDLLMLGVTGTNGKTTTAYLLESGLRASGHRTGLIGTVGTRIGDDWVSSVRTTPEATDVHALLAVMREHGVSACAMEVSSHAMSYGRVDGVDFDVVGFTNLSRDHLDFHADLEEYFAAKARLFAPEHANRGVVVVGSDEYSRRLVERPLIPTSRVEHARPATGQGSQTELSREQRGDVSGQRRWTVERGVDIVSLAGPDGETLSLHVPIPGEFNVTNAALAVAMLAEAGTDAAVAAEGIATCAGVPGRMERVGSDPDAPVMLVDFAHTPDAIDNVLQALTPTGRLIVVIGAGGDRDRDKRGLMGQAAALAADVVVVTDDNPRSEDPADIRAAVLAGAQDLAAPERAELVEVADRRTAIRAALHATTGPGDVVVVLGKGHEQGQEIAGVVHPFDDRDVLRSELGRWREENPR